MSCQRGQVRWRASMAAIIYLLPSFCLETKGPKIQGRHQGPTTHGRRPSPMSAFPPRPTQLGFGVPEHGIRTRNSTPTDKAPPFTLMADKDPPSPTPPEDYTPCCRFASSRAKRGNPFMTDLRKICFQKNPFHSQQLTRQQTTTVDYKRLINGFFLTRFASLWHNSN